MGLTTHEVINQPPVFGGMNLFECDRTLREAVSAYGAPTAEDFSAYGDLAGNRLADLGRLANRYPPELRAFDEYGRRVDEVEFHPAYHELMGTSIAHGVHSRAWEQPPGGHAAQAVLQFLHAQADAGTSCPLTMTYASVPTIEVSPGLAERWLPKILSRRYDPSARPFEEKDGVTVGMAMTEKQGGSDVRANTTTATRLEVDDGVDCYALSGHKWFCSAPMSDAFLTLAQLDDGLTCFLVPRWRPDATRNAFHLQRLKDKLGNRSNASAELELDNAFAWIVGDPGRGVANIIQMVALTRFNCMASSAALMRHAMVRAYHHVAHRAAFGKRLIDQPLMRNVIADLMLDCEATLWFSFRVARALDRAPEEPAADTFVRLGTPIGKYWICKRASAAILEAQECLGGFGYVEDSVLPRLLREAPVNSIWEGSGNIQCLDVLRALSRTPDAAQVLRSELGEVKGMNRGYDEALGVLDKQLGRTAEFDARSLVEGVALLLGAKLMLEHTPEPVANAFVQSRLTRPSANYGMLEDNEAVDWLLDRVTLP